MDPSIGNSYYEILGVPFEATSAEIRNQYHSIIRTLHPDKRRPGSISSDDRLHQVQHAWRCLSDETRRLLYDLRNFGRSSLDTKAGVEGDGRHAAEARLNTLQKEQALRDVENMQVEFEKKVKIERKSRGVILQLALYGDLRLREDCLESAASGGGTIEPEDLVGPFVDVTLPLQCLVENHALVLPGGTSVSKADLRGFFNPAPLDLDVELSLYVLYEFRGNLHEVIVNDRETLSLPRRKQEVPAGQAPRGPFSPANVSLLRSYGSAPRKNSSEKDVTRPRRVQRAMSAETASRDALRQAVCAYRLQAMQVPSPEDATPAEFAAVVIVGAAMLAAAGWWASRTSRD